MNNKQETFFKKMLQDLTGLDSFDNEKLKPLLDQMDLMSTLFEALTAAKTHEELVGIGSRIRSCQQESSEMMNGFLSHYGAKPEQTKAYFSNPNLIGKKEWGIVKDMYQKLLQSEAKLAPTVSTRNKRKGRKKV